MVDFKRFDRARRSIEPVQVDLVEAYAQGRISRRDFVRRGTVIGLSMPLMATIIAACGSSNKGGTTSGTTAGTKAGSTGTTVAGTAAPKAGGTFRVGIQKPAGPLDPVAMQDLGTYGVICQCFEYLATINADDIAPGLAEKWTPNTDGSVWTFNLRQGVKWHDGSPFTADDVVATMDRLADAGNAGLKGVLAKGGAAAKDANTVVFTLESPNGNFPYLVSLYNPQSAITPKAFASGSTLDKTPNGTGPFKLSKFDAASGASFVRNDAWWGGKAPLDGTEWTFFDEVGPQIAAYQGGQIDCIQQFQVVGGDALFNDANFNVIAKRTAAHRQIWMRCDTGQFADKRVRQALALTLDREKLVQQLFKGKADIGNDHVIAPLYPFFDASVPQRSRDIEKAKALLADAGKTGLKAVLHCGELQEIPDLAVLIQSGAKDAGIELDVQKESLDTFYGAQWCPDTPKDPPCSGAAELGIVDYGHRAVPDVYLNAALATKGVWNSSQYSSKDFDAAFGEYKAAIDLAGHKAAATKLEKILNEDVPVGVPYFYNYLAGHSKKFANVVASALGQLFLGATTTT